MSYIRLTFGPDRIALLASCVFVGLAFSITLAMAGCNSGDIANSSLLSSANCRAFASDQHATAVGQGASSADGGTAVGFAAGAGDRGTALGWGAKALDRFATSVGIAAGRDVNAEGATRIGAGAGAAWAGSFSTAVGAGSTLETGPQARGGNSIAIGGGSLSTFRGANAWGFRSIAIGQKSVSDDFGTSLGFNTNTFFASTAIGTDAQATADSSTALGRFAKASGNSSLALGRGAVASTASSVALGSGSVTYDAFTISVGTINARRRIVNVAPAFTNTDAVNFAQAKALATEAAQAEIAAASGIADLRRELADLRATVERQEVLVQRQQGLLSQQQQEIAELKGQKSAALAE